MIRLSYRFLSPDPTDSSGNAPDKKDADKEHFFELEGIDEDASPSEGHFFAEAPPEPPPQTFELLRLPEDEEPETASTSDELPSEPNALETDIEPDGLSIEPRDKTGMPEPSDTPPTTPPPAQPAPPRPVKPKRPARPSLLVRLIWHSMPLLVFLLGYGVVILGQSSSIGYAWDEAYYYEPSLDAAEWCSRVLHGERPFSEQAIDKYWSKISEHPSMLKFVSGLGLLIFQGSENPLWAMRWPISILFGLTLTLIYLLGRRVWGPAPALLAVLIYMTLPRVLGHAHFVSYETPLVFMTVLVVYCYLKGLDSAYWSVMTGISFGLLLATKINGFFLPIALLLWSHLFARSRYVNNLFSMIFIGPLVMIAVWPWLWHESALRFLNYLAFHLTHQQTSVYFLGERFGYGNPNAPWFYPLAMTAWTVPIFSLFLIVWGLLHTLRLPHRRPISMLFVACLLVMYGVACAPGTPKYDGVRLFLTVFPFLALLGGAGAVSLMKHLTGIFIRGSRTDPERQRYGMRLMAWILGGCLIFQASFTIPIYHSTLLSYFNRLVGGLPGAAERGLEVTYWGEAINGDVLEIINALPSDTRLRVHAAHLLCLQQQQEWGKIDEQIDLSGQAPFNCHLVVMRRGMFGNEEIELVDQHRRGAMPLDASRRLVIERMGVPMVGFYWTGPGPSPFPQIVETLGLDSDDE